MTFRANEERIKNRERALDYFIPKQGSSRQKEEARNIIIDIIEEYGPVIDSYPTWHPIVSCFPRDPLHHFAPSDPTHIESFRGLDHTVLLAHGFISCPYQGADKLIEKINNSYELLNYNNSKIATIKAERLDIPLYNIKTETIFVKCDWEQDLYQNNGTIPKNIAVPLMLEREIPCWRFSECGESWESMRREFLGLPHGNKSSLFVDQETGQAMKNIWNMIINTGMFGTTVKI
jgi:hypothetical protein